jgi:hypothetical protein
MVCDEDWETRHPQDFVRGVADVQAPPWTRPESDVFISISYTRQIADTPTLTEAPAKKTSKPISDSITASETFKALRTYFKSETITASETRVSSIKPALSDTGLFSERLTESLVQGTKAETITGSESANYVLIKTISDSVSITEGSSTIVNPSIPLNKFALNTYSLG